jgi:hypothetical protein
VTVGGFWIGELDLLRFYTPPRTTHNYSAIADLHNLQFTLTHTHTHTHTLGFSVFITHIMAIDFNTVIIQVSL